MKHVLLGNAQSAAIKARQEPPIFIDDHPDPVGQAIHDVDAAVMRLVELATHYDNRKQMAQERYQLRGSLAGLQIICSVLEGVE